MFQLKIIYDPKWKRKWIVHNDGITKFHYKGALPWSELTYHDRNVILFWLNRMINQEGGVARCVRDIIRPLTIQEYMFLSDTLQKCNIKYNKKKNQIICQNQTN